MWLSAAGGPGKLWCSSGTSLKAWEPGSQWCKSRSESKGLRTRNANIQRQEKMDISGSQTTDLLFLCLFVLLSSSKDWMMLMTNGWGQSSLLNLLILMLISSRNTLTDRSRNNVLPAIWASHRTVKFIHKINYHKDVSIFHSF